MEQRNLNRSLSFGFSDIAMEIVMGYIDDPRDRAAISLVCHNWWRVDANTRKHLTIALCYSTSPERLRRRFPRLESLKLKGKPRAAMFYNLIPDDWGGYTAPWIAEIATTFLCLKEVHFRRMIVEDDDINVLVSGRGYMLQALKLDKCSGFSTDGLLLVATKCRILRTLFLEESSIAQRDDGWLHELAVNNSFLETLNFYMTDISVSLKDLELIANNCKLLVSLKISDYDVSNLVGLFRAATTLEEFGGGTFDEVGEPNRYSNICFPPKLFRLALTFMGKNDMHIIFPFANKLKKLDLQYTFLNTEDHWQLIQRCPNLEILEVRNVIGDRGVEVLSQTCRRLRRLRIEQGEDEEDEEGMVTHRGLIALAEGCPELEYLAVHVSDITNAALECIGTFSRNLCDFRLVLLDEQERIAELPLDNGVRALLQGCVNLRRFALYVRPGGLTDVGLGYLGEFSSNVRWMLLGCVGDSDDGIRRLSTGCPNLQKLELRGCRFSERALAHAVLQLASLRYIWVQGYTEASPAGSGLLAMVRPYWNIEYIPPRQAEAGFGHPAQILAYYSLDGRRTDCPESVQFLHVA